MVRPGTVGDKAVGFAAAVGLRARRARVRADCPTNSFEERGRPRLAVDDQLKLLPLKSVDKVTFLVENCDRRLHQLRIDADSFLVRLLSVHGCTEGNDQSIE